MGAPLILALGGVALLPFATQDFDYVSRQFAEVPDMLRWAADRESPQTFPQMVGLLRTLGVDLEPGSRLVLRVAAALATLAGYAFSLRRCAVDKRGLLLYGLATSDILLFGSGTERNTYAMMAPPLVLLWLCTAAAGRRGAAVLLGCMVLGSLLLASKLAGAYPDSFPAMLRPLICMGFLVLLVRHVLVAAPGPGPAVSSDR